MLRLSIRIYHKNGFNFYSTLSMVYCFCFHSKFHYSSAKSEFWWTLPRSRSTDKITSAIWCLPCKAASHRGFRCVSISWSSLALCWSDWKTVLRLLDNSWTLDTPEKIPGILILLKNTYSVGLQLSTIEHLSETSVPLELCSSYPS